MIMFDIYLIICFIGLILLIVFALLGGFGAAFETDVGDVDVGDIDVDVGDVDVGDVDVDSSIGGHPSPLSLPLILLFMTSFGAFGAIFEIFKLDLLLVPLISGGLSILIAGGMFLVLAKIFASTESTSVVPLRKTIGLKAKVSISIKKNNEGQIVVIPPKHGRILVGAIADKNIPTDSVVEILEVIGDVVKVKKVKKGKKKQSVMKLKK